MIFPGSHPSAPRVNNSAAEVRTSGGPPSITAARSSFKRYRGARLTGASGANEGRTSYMARPTDLLTLESGLRHRGERG